MTRRPHSFIRVYQYSYEVDSVESRGPTSGVVAVAVAVGSELHSESELIDTAPRRSLRCAASPLGFGVSATRDETRRPLPLCFHSCVSISCSSRVSSVRTTALSLSFILYRTDLCAVVYSVRIGTPIRLDHIASHFNYCSVQTTVQYSNSNLLYVDRYKRSKLDV